MMDSVNFGIYGTMMGILLRVKSGDSSDEADAFDRVRRTGASSPKNMSGHHQDWKEITIGKRPSSTGSGSAKAAKDPKAVAAVRACDDDGKRRYRTTTRLDVT